MHYILNKKLIDNYGKQVVFKLINNQNYSIREVILETNKYNKQGVSVFWILNADKFHNNKEFHYNFKGLRQNVNLTELELFIHEMLRGRVYYVDLKRDILFECHFSLPDNRKLHEVLKKRIRRKRQNIVRNANLYRYENYNLLIPDKNYFISYSICRLYDNIDLWDRYYFPSFDSP